jgi:P-type conjugative transfer protein TrbJ
MKPPFFIIVTLVLACTMQMAYSKGGGFGGIVFDPTNYTQNLSSAVTAVRQETQMLRDYLNQIQQLRAQVEAAKNLSRDVITGEVARIASDSAKVKNLIGSNQELERGLLSQRELLETMSRIQKLRGQTPKEFLEGELRGVQAGQVTATRRLNAAKENAEFINGVNQRRDKIASSMSSDQSVTQAVQSNSQLLSLLVSQNNQVISGLAKAEAERGKEKSEETRDSLARFEAEERIRLRAEMEDRERAKYYGSKEFMDSLKPMR